MKTSSLIKVLQAGMKQHGDLPVKLSQYAEINTDGEDADLVGVTTISFEEPGVDIAPKYFLLCEGQTWDVTCAGEETTPIEEPLRQ